MMLIQGLISVRILLVLLALSACSSVYQPPDAQTTDLALARFEQAKLNPTSMPRTLADEAAMVQRIKERLQPAAGPLCAQSGQTRCAFRINLIDDTETINAAASGQNQIDVYRGLIQSLPGEAELAFIVAHEMGHHLAGHLNTHDSYAALGKAVGGALFGLAGMMVGANLSEINKVMRDGETAGAYYASGWHSVADEHEADYIGVYLLARAGYDPKAAVRAIDYLAAQSQGSAVPLLFKTHPDDDTRSARLRRSLIEIETKQRQGQPLLPNHT